MSQSYFSLKKLRRQSKQPEAVKASTETESSPPAPAVTTPSEEPAASPVLDEEDEKFLQRLAAISEEPESTPPPLPTRPVKIVEDGETKVGKDAQEAIMDGANQVPLPMSPPEVTAEDTEKGKEKAKDGGLNRRKSVMSYFTLAQSKLKKATEKEKGAENEHKGKKKDKITSRDKQKAADDLLSAAEATKSAEQKQAEKEQEDMTKILDQLNLSAVNNRVFSFSKESEELFNKFNLVLKDIVNGVPTAYDDLEKLFTDYEGQLKKMYGSLPPFIQNLIKSLPAKLTGTLGPEILAMQAEKPGFDAKQRAAASGGTKSKLKRATIPSLKSLISAEGAVATMLKSILQFLKLRFPAILTGTNVVMSLAVCSKFSFASDIVNTTLYSRVQYSSLSSGIVTSAAVRPALRKKASQLKTEIPPWPVVLRPFRTTATPSSGTQPGPKPTQRQSKRLASRTKMKNLYPHLSLGTARKGKRARRLLPWKICLVSRICPILARQRCKK
jgi:hypothetical protein